jgi:hypothetical protein
MLIQVKEYTLVGYKPYYDPNMKKNLLTYEAVEADRVSFKLCNPFFIQSWNLPPDVQTVNRKMRHLKSETRI